MFVTKAEGARQEARTVMPKKTKMADKRSTKERIEPSFSAAVKLRDAEDWEGAERMLRRILAETRDVPPAVNAVLGHVLWEQSKCGEAIPFLQRAAKQSPRHEGISSALFHCLYEDGRLTEALNEGRRFLSRASVGEFHDYREAVEAVAAKGKKKRT